MNFTKESILDRITFYGTVYIAQRHDFFVSGTRTEVDLPENVGQQQHGGYGIHRPEKVDGHGNGQP